MYGRYGKDKENGLKGTHGSQNTTEMGNDKENYSGVMPESPGM